MTKTTVACDRCGRVVEVDRTLLGVEAGPIRARWPSFDLCSGCAGDLLEWLGSSAIGDAEHAEERGGPSGAAEGE